MILCDRDLHSLLREGQLVDPYEPELVNPASIDIRLGAFMMREHAPTFELQKEPVGTKACPSQLQPQEFILIETFERLIVPNGYSVELKLKSSRAREGFNHSLAFWFDPGWNGIGTMEVMNVRRRSLEFWIGMPFGQIIVHRNSGESQKPYTGRYQGATVVESAKREWAPPLALEARVKPSC